MEDRTIILKKYWGYDSFRSPQDLIIDSVIALHDTIALLPTGGGKSLCFQIPALMFQGKTIVVSPLIALMQDQVDHLRFRNINAKALHSNLTYQQIDAILDDFVYGDIKLLYISPERIKSEMFSLRIAKAKVSLIAIDEAHCISQWGYDFRPAYFNIPTLRQIHPKVPFITLTATATPKVITDISEKLELKEPAIFKKSFVRDNLSFTVLETENKLNEVIQILDKVRGCAVIYVRNRKETIEIAQWLNHCGISCASYHGGMEKTVREKNQQAWMQNKVRLMVSTNAFGMGIDKPDVRLVIHMDIAPSIEEYYQEAGRAGRDGLPAYAVIVSDASDVDVAKQNYEDQYPSLEIIGSVYERLCRFLKVAYGAGMMETYDFHIMDFAEYLSVPVRKVFHILNILEKEGWVAFSEAFKEPSRLMILANQEDLDFLHREKNMKTTIIVHLLRKYEGLFTEPVKIDESKIASELRMEETQLVHHLQALKAEGYISYQQRSSEPQITFMQDRPEQNSFSIDKRLYQLRKKNAGERLNSMISYVKNESKCRQNVLVEYFGEKVEDCGRCDICVGKSKTSLTDEQIEKIYNHLLMAITQKPVDLNQYVRLYPFNKRKRVIRALKDFESEGKLRIDNSGFIYPPA